MGVWHWPKKAANEFSTTKYDRSMTKVEAIKSDIHKMLCYYKCCGIDIDIRLASHSKEKWTQS